MAELFRSPSQGGAGRRVSALLSHWSAKRARPRRLLPVFLAWPFPLATTSSQHPRPSLFLTPSGKVASLVPTRRSSLSRWKRHRRARRACTYSSRRQAPNSRAAPWLCVRPRRLSKQRQRMCTLFRPACFPSVVVAHVNLCTYTHWYAPVCVDWKNSKKCPNIRWSSWNKCSDHCLRALLCHGPCAHPSNNNTKRVQLLHKCRVLSDEILQNVCAHDPCACRWRQDEEEADRQTEEDRGDCDRPGVRGGQNHPPPSSERKSGVLPEVEGLHRVSGALHFHICKRLREMIKWPHSSRATVQRTRGNLRTT